MDGMNFTTADVVIIVTIVGFFIRQEIIVKAIVSLVKSLGEDHAKLMSAVNQAESTTIEEHRGMVSVLNEMQKTQVQIVTMLKHHLDDERSKP